LVDGYPLPNVDMMWTNHNFAEAQLWLSHYISIMQLFVSMLGLNTTYVNLAYD